jgi:hypothetical protein
MVNLALYFQLQGRVTCRELANVDIGGDEQACGEAA